MENESTAFGSKAARKRGEPAGDRNWTCKYATCKGKSVDRNISSFGIAWFRFLYDSGPINRLEAAMTTALSHPTEPFPAETDYFWKWAQALRESAEHKAKLDNALAVNAELQARATRQTATIRALRELVRDIDSLVHDTTKPSLEMIADRLAEARESELIAEDCELCGGEGLNSDDHMIGDPGSAYGYSTERVAVECAEVGCRDGRKMR